MPRKWKSRLWILPALLLISSLLAFAVYDGLSGLTTSHRQFQTLSSFYRLDYAEMIKVIGPPDVDEGVKGIVEWHSLNDENVSFGVDYVSWENRRKPNGITVYFPTRYGHKRCRVTQPPDTGYVEFLFNYHLRCDTVIKTQDELRRHEERYRTKLAKLAAV